MIITFCNQKGGVGKTTLAVNLAALLRKKTQRRVVVVDLDVQGTARAWVELAKLDVEVSAHMEDQDQKAVFIVDTPANLHLAAAQRAIQTSQLVVVPCTESPTDVQPTKRTVEVVRSLTKVPVLLVINSSQEWTILSKMTEEWVKELGVTVADTRIHARQVWRQAVCNRWVESGPAHEELQGLALEIMNHMSV